MRVLTKEEVDKERIKLIRELRNCLFIHPTDTVYGIGCNATERQLVRKLRSAKEQFSRPLSVIAPSMEWIRKNCKVQEKAEEWLDKLPGPYTFILELDDMDAITRNTNLGKDTIGVRIPDHWFSSMVNDMKTPVITTSANVTGTNIMTSLEDLDESLKKAVDYTIYEGEITGKPSEIVNLTKKEPEIIRKR